MEASAGAFGYTSLESWQNFMASERVIAGIERNAFWFCLTITLLAAFLRLHELGARSFWFDEAIEVIVARAPLSSFWSTALQQRLPDPPLSSMLMHLMIRIGAAEFIVRYPYALLGTMAVYAGYHLFRLWLRPAGALIAQALLALAPAQVYYSQEGGQYALMAFVSVMIFWSFERALRRTSGRNLALFTLFAALGILSHYGMFWLLGGLALLLLWRTRPAGWLRWWPSGLALALLSLLIVVLMAAPQYRVLQTVVPDAPSFGMNTLRALYGNLSSAAHMFSDFGGRWQGSVTAATWFFVGLFLSGLVIALRRPSYRPAAGLFVVPLLVAYLAAQAGLFLWGGRYVLFLSPIFYLITGVALTTLLGVRLGWVVSMLALGVLLFNQMYAGWPNEELGEHMRPVVRRVQEEVAANGTPVYVLYSARPAFQVYYGGDMENVRIGIWIRNLPLEEKMADVLPSFREGEESWFVASHYRVPELTAIREQLERRCRPGETMDLSNALAIRYQC